MVYANRVDSLAAAEAAITGRTAECAVVLQPGFGEAARVGGPAPVEILAAGDHPFATRMTDALVRDFLSRAAATATADGLRDLPSVIPLSPGGRLRTVDFFAASLAVLFLNFAVLSGVRALQSEIDSGTIARLVAAPAAPVALFAGKFAALVILGLVQMAVMIAATSLLFGTTWGNPLPVTALVGASVLMAIGLTAFLIVSTGLAFGVSWGDPLGVLLVTAALICFGVSLVFCMGTVFRTPEQAISLGPWIGVVLGMLGGCMWPREGVPPFLKTLGYCSPAAWAMDAYLALIFGRVSARLILPEVTVLLLFAATLAIVGLLRLRRQFSR